MRGWGMTPARAGGGREETLGVPSSCSPSRDSAGDASEGRGGRKRRVKHLLPDPTGVTGGDPPSRGVRVGPLLGAGSAEPFSGKEPG